MNVLYSLKPGRKAPHEVRVVYPQTTTIQADGKKVRKRPQKFFYFESKTQADAKARELRKIAKGVSGLPEEFSHSVALATVHGMSFADAVEEGVKARSKNKRFGNIVPDTDVVEHQARLADTVDQAREKYIAHLKAGGRRPSYYEGREELLAALFKPFAGRQFITLTKEELAKHFKGKAVETERTYLNLIAALLRRYGMEDWTKAAKGRFKKEDQKQVESFTLDECKAIMRVASPLWRGQIALCLFVGLRPEKLHLLTPEYLHPEEQKIRLPAKYMKSRTWESLEGTATVDGITYQGIPPVLWKWLAKCPYRPGIWQHIQKNLSKRLKEIGLKWKHDGLRHTFASNYYALYGLAATAHMLTHSDLGEVKQHYRNSNVTRTQALEFFAWEPEDYPDKKAIVWPNKHDLIRMLHETSPEEIGARLGCTGAAVRKHCKIVGVVHPNWRSQRLQKDRADTREAMALIRKEAEVESAIEEAAKLGL